MAFRGALLKPSERNGKAAKPTRAISSQSRYEVLKEKIRTWWHDRLKIGEHLKEIRDGKLYKHEHSNFEDFCVAEFDLKHSQAYALIAAVDVKASVKPSAIAERITNEGQARALAPVPAEQRAEVMEKVIDRGTVTAKAITEVAKELTVPAAKEIKPAKVKDEAAKAKHLDKTGYAIPESIYADWQQADSFRLILNDLHRVKLSVEKSLENSDLGFREIGKDSLIELTNAWTTLKCVLPYAVCPTCQGRTRDKCSVCKGRGFVSEFAYNNWFPKKTIEIREGAIKK